MSLLGLRRLPVALLSSCFIFLSYLLAAQTVDNTASYRIVDARKYVRLYADNDYFTATDDYYTQGVNIEFVHPGLSNLPFRHALLLPKSFRHTFGIALEHNGYTPTSIERDDIIYGDRPFAGTMMLKVFSMSVDSIHHRRVYSSLALGVIGPSAGGFGIQKTVHQWIHYTIPHGWNNQIQNDIIINYEAGIEHNILKFRNRFIINTDLRARVGTLNTKASAGAVIMLGKLNPAIYRAFVGQGKEALSTRKLRFHAYAQPMVNAVGYDATLQGGLFNRSSPYTMKDSEIERVTVQVNYGFVLTFRAVYLEYFKAYIGKEFKTGDHHRWGGIRIGITW